ncbi:MAG: MMPL family transporter, partial [Thermoplasmata archaeon]|nr:MMPL family transporter [Thermoplasmata archaeon]
MADENDRDNSGDDYAEEDDEGWDDDEYWQEDEPKYIDEDAGFKPQKELPQKLSTAARRTDAFFDSLLSKATGTAEKSREKLEEYAPKVKKGAKRVIRTTGTRIKKIDDYGDEYSAKIFRKDMFDKFIVMLIRNPLTFLIIVGLISGTIFFFGAAPKEYGGADFQDNIRGDMNVYLPQGHETQETWDEIQEDWSTDIIVIFVETDNVIGDIARRGITNITDVDVLNDMSRVEETVDYDKEDRGRVDGIVFILSFSTLIKEMNSTLPRFADAVRYEFSIDIDLGMVEGEYTIPDQQKVDRIYEEIPPEASNSIIIDSNDDTIIDTSIILIGLHKDSDQAKMLDLVEDTVRAEAHHCNMTLTGPIPMTHAITERTYSEVTKTLPAALLMVAAVLILFHRTWKIVVITSVPIVTSVAITFGILGITDMVLTPQVVLIAPVLIALGVAYGLYIANRYSDERDIVDREERIRKAVKTTGKAIFLSAVTTSIGFASLMTVQMIPLQVLGFGLSIGILLCYLTTILTVPSLVMLLDYRKKGEIKSREKIGNIPVNNRKKIVGAAIILTVISAILIPSVAANMDYVKMAPQDEPVIQKMREYGEKFGGGDFGLILVTGDPAEEADIDDSMKDIEVLKDIEDLEEQINDDPNNPNDPYVENAKALSIVTIMKTIKIPEFEIQGAGKIVWGFVQDQFEDYMNITFWDALKRAGDYPTIYNPMINIFYNTLTP